MNKIYKVIGVTAYWLAWPLLFIRLSGSLRTRVVIAVDDQVLLVNGWLGDFKGSLPGGGAKPSESPEMAAIREVREEVGIVLQPASLRKLEERYFKENKIGFNLVFYGVRLSHKPKVKLQKTEIAQYNWRSLAEINKNNASRDTIIGVNAWKKLS